MKLREFLKTGTFKKNALAAVGITLLLVVFIMVFLRIYTDHGDSVQIPDLKGKSMNEAASMLEQVDLRFQIKDSVYSAEATPGSVLDQYPKPGMKVKENRIIFITMCALSQEMIPMPQLTDISYRQAINLIQNAGLIEGNVQYKKSEFPNLVLEQSVNGRMVAKGEMIPKGSTVDLVIGSESDGLTSQIPVLTGHSLDDAQVLLEEASLRIGTVNYDETITTEEQKLQGLIYKQSPDPAQLFETDRGSSIDVWLTVDPAKIQNSTETEKPDNSFF